MKIGDFNVRLIADGKFWIDGGAMFGIVPKVLWGRAAECDNENRIPLALNCLLVETPEKRIIFDAGLGAETSAKFKRIYSVTDARGMRFRLEEAGLKAEDIDMVIFSHLHFDHADGATETVGGKRAPIFPNAEYLAQAGEWRDALNANEFTAGGYNAANLEALEKSGRLRLIEGDAEVSPGIHLRVTGGHTAHHQMLLVESRGRKAASFADLIPMRAHLPLPYIMALDTEPLQTLESKRKVLRSAAEENWLCFFGHECDNAAGRVRLRNGRYIFEPAE